MSALEDGFPEHVCGSFGFSRICVIETGIELLRDPFGHLLERPGWTVTEHVAGRGSVTLMSADPGDVFGWSALITPFKATSTVVSLEPVKVIAIDAASLREEVRSNCELAAGIYPKLLEALARRLGATRHQLLDLYGSEQTEPW